MKEMDCVEVIVEKEKYIRDGVHKGMQGWICDSEFVNGTWLVNFPQYGPKRDIATISVREEDLMLLPNGMDARINERIKELHEGGMGESMKKMDCVEVIAQKEEYAKEGVHKGMQGWICFSECVNESWLVNFPQCKEKSDIATIFVKESDLVKIPLIYAEVNEKIKDLHEAGVEESMKEPDCVEVIVEKEEYAKEGVHKGMQGRICDSEFVNGTWLVNFPQYGPKRDIATISVREEDLMLLPNGMDAQINERIKEFHEGGMWESMKEPDCVEVIVEKEEYAKEGVHKGMQGRICYSEYVNESWLVNFPQCKEKSDIATIFVKEIDLVKIPLIYAAVNEIIKAQHES